MKIGVVGCGFVADFYMATLHNHPGLEVAGVYDRDPTRLAAFAQHHAVAAFATFEQMLADPAVELIVNVTNPASHFEVSHQALVAGKHVFSEKPLALSLEDAQCLADLAGQRKLSLSGAPSSLLSGTAQTVDHLLRKGEIGRPRLVYANLDSGPIHLESYREWRSPSGAYWPAEDEFAVGCTLEHAAYYLTWLCYFFGPVRRGSAWSSRLAEDKFTGQPVQAMGPDFTCACLEFDDGLVARVTCGMIAPQDLSMQIFGETGGLRVADAWNFRAPVTVTDFRGVAKREIAVMDLATLCPAPSQMDFARGVAAQALAIASGQSPLASPELLVHVTEIMMLLNASDGGGTFRPTTTLAPRRQEDANLHEHMPLARTFVRPPASSPHDAVGPQ